MAAAGDNISKALRNVNRHLKAREHQAAIPFDAFLKVMADNPAAVMRNVFQVFHDMVKNYVAEGPDEYSSDPESIHYVNYDSSRLFVEDVDNPFFADRLFANRLINLVESLQRGAQQNKIYIFEGPHGCGKSTFLNNLLRKFETYANTEEGVRFEAVWRLDRRSLASIAPGETNRFLDKLGQLLDDYEFNQAEILEAKKSLLANEDFIEVPCPSHDNPMLVVPKDYRRAFFDDLFKNDESKWRLFTAKEYEWVFKDKPCTICSSIFQALLNRLGKPEQVFAMLYARRYRFNRRLGQGISVFSPGDTPPEKTVLHNEILQNRINDLLRDSSLVRYLSSRYARTNNGIYALMDIKSHNVDRLIELHNIISEGVHKVEDIEENVNSLLLAVMNPEDQKNIEGLRSFLDRVEYIKIPYVLDLNTEVQIYRNIFGRQLDESFLPRVLHNFARLIISTRLEPRSPAMEEWILDPGKYRLFCDPNLLLLKMEIYTGHIPEWLTAEDRKRLTAKRRRRIIGESEAEGARGLSGRDAIKIFNDLYSSFGKSRKLITMSMLRSYFTRMRSELGEQLPMGLLDSLLQMYNYTVLQEVKEALYYFNEERISREIQNYLFAVNFEPGTVARCEFTGEQLSIDENFLRGIEVKLLGEGTSDEARIAFRTDTQREYTSRTLTQEILAEGRAVAETRLFGSLHEQYVHHLKEKVLDPFLANENFRRAVRDLDKPAFKTYDKKIRDDVTFMIGNLCSRFRYTKAGAQAVCIYVIDNDLARAFSDI
ncbi:serine protein kinase PrkA [uncultured Desulfuromonas sp.]|uniref:serine protein kinase PrkA n=1 Tax=uncultured Desulfuromonas sp. TaxID=181013 RepID=UPI002626594E|nr:serine protein kinase PrkA [uncultured Desulfuromonas sp.]